jgi:hypothetical protein
VAKLLLTASHLRSPNLDVLPADANASAGKTHYVFVVYSWGKHLTKRFCVGLAVALSVVLGSAGGALAVPPNPIRQAAQLDLECQNPHGVAGIFTHGAWVSSVARLAPADPYVPECPVVIIPDS